MTDHSSPLKIITDFVDSFPKDEETENYPRQVSGALYAEALPKAFPAQEEVHRTSIAQALGWEGMEEVYRQLLKEKAPHLPFAMGYAGHQFGHWAGQLGDGRAINFFQKQKGNSPPLTIQVKGCGPTPFSRRGDGYAVLRSSIREYLCAEAMYYLGVPTTRSLFLSKTGEQVARDPQYNGQIIHETGAIVGRVAESFIRFGHFEYAAAQPETSLLKDLLDYSITHHYPHIQTDQKDSYLQWFSEVCKRTLETVIHWQRVGFVHGVMNTDNMSILGLTIDYGPYGWLADYNHDFTPNTSDQEGRYRFGKQGEIALYNLIQLANAIYRQVNDQEGLETVSTDFKTDYQKKYYKMMSAKLGLLTNEDADQVLIDQLVQLLHLHPTDMTVLFALLYRLDLDTSKETELKTLTPSFYDNESMSEAHQLRWLDWLSSYQERRQQDQINRGEQPIEFNKARRELLSTTNPTFILRNHLTYSLTETLEKEKDPAEVEALFKRLQHPYDYSNLDEIHIQKQPDWARRTFGCSQLSCSS